MTRMLSGEFRRKDGYTHETVSELENLYPASMWTNTPGRLFGAAMVGRVII